MSGVQHRLKLKQTPIDTWSLKEQLTLTSAVLRTGDQNWVSVSRTMKQFWEPGRPPDWYSQKNCALQYSLIMDKADLPRRKRGEKLEGKDSPGETIVRMLGKQRQEQLRVIIDKEKKDIEKLEKQVQLLSSENVPEEEIQNIIKEIEREEEEEARKDEEHAQFLKNREEKKMAIQAALKSGISVYWKGQMAPQSVSEQSGSELDSAVDSPMAEETPNTEDTKPVVPSSTVMSSELVTTSTPEVENHVEVEHHEEVSSQPPVTHADTIQKDTELPEDANKEAEEDGEVGQSEVVCMEQLEVETKSSVDAQDDNMKIIIVDSPIKSQGPAADISHSKQEKVASTSEDKLKTELIEDKDKDEDDDIDDAEEITGDDLDEEGKADGGEEEEETEEKAEEADSGEKPDDTVEEVVAEPAEVEAKETEIVKDEGMKGKDDEEMEVEQSEEPSVPTTDKEKEVVAAEDVPDAAPEVGSVKGPEPVKSTPRRGRPRSKKSSEVLTEPPKLDTKLNPDESGDVSSSRASSPASCRRTSPSPEVNRSGSRESEAGNRLLARRSSRPSGSRGALDSTPGSPVNPQQQEDEKEAKAWRKSILLVWSQIAAHKHASLFAGPVSEAEAPEYKDIVFQPMDLGTIKKNIENGTIRTTEEFQCDLALMFFNATMYNSSDHAVYKLTLFMQKDTDNIIREYLHTQALMKASEVPKLRMKEIMEATVGRTRTGSGSSIPEDKKKHEEKRKRASTLEEYPAAKKRRLRNFDE